jgi:hypothetical protein
MESANSQVSDAVRWQAPEMANVAENDIAARAQNMEKADVWSFALTSLEVSIIGILYDLVESLNALHLRF